MDNKEVQDFIKEMKCEIDFIAEHYEKNYPVVIKSNDDFDTMDYMTSQYGELCSYIANTRDQISQLRELNDYLSQKIGPVSEYLEKQNKVAEEHNFGIRPCPFCNGKAEVVFDLSSREYERTDYVECNECGIRTKSNKNKQAAIKQWNNRFSENNGVEGENNNS